MKQVNIIFYLLLCLIFIFFAFALFIVIAGMSDAVHPSDAGVVLGSQVLPNGTPSKRLQARLDKAIELYKNGTIKTIIVSGGIGKEGFNEALVMRDYIISIGNIPINAIITDESGYTTRKTAQNAYELMKRHGFSSVIVITQYFHTTRSKLAFRQAGIDKIYSAYPQYFEWRDLYSIGREMAALPAYWLN